MKQPLKPLINEKTSTFVEVLKVVPAGIEPATQGFSELRPQVSKATCGLFIGFLVCDAPSNAPNDVHRT